ncbi:MAG TPA: TOBE domain-containing protein, partial [Actinomycetota bacterium]|nr:TOBE domain-containing protein [Actinomycetota bacterium]
GDRVAVMRKGMLQQVDTPQTLYDHPANLFVAGFIGSPAMNMVEAELSSENGAMFIGFGRFRLRLDDKLVAAKPALKTHAGKNVVLGIRPEDMEDAVLVGDAPQDRRISASVDLREALGSQVLIHFTVGAPMVLTEDTKELASDVGTEALESLEVQAKEDKSTFVAQLDPRTRIREGEQVELVVDTGRLHFFDPETGLGIYGNEGS